MKFIHLTAKRFQSVSADSIYITNLAENFAKILGKDYLLVLGGMSKGQFKDINTINLNLLSWGTGLVYFMLPYFFYFFWLPYFLIFKITYKDKITFFLSDPNILWILILWKKLLRINFKIISDWHMLHNDWKDKFIAHNSDILITTSNKLKKLLCTKIGVSDKNILTVYGGVDLELFKADQNFNINIKENLGIPKDKVLVAYIGLFKTMGMEKGIITMLQSISFVSHDILMVFVGGKEKEILEYSKVAEKMGVLDKCIFIKKIVEQNQVYAIEQAVDVLVIPYPDKPHFREYGFPMKVYEYLAAQKPIIYSKLDLAEEVLSDCGFLFEPDDPKSLASTLSYVLASENQSEVKSKINLGYQKLINFTWSKKAQKILEYI